MYATDGRRRGVAAAVGAGVAGAGDVGAGGAAVTGAGVGGVADVCGVVGVCGETVGRRSGGWVPTVGAGLGATTTEPPAGTNTDCGA